MKKTILILLLFFLPISVKAIEITSDYAILYNMNDESVLFTKNENEKIPIASLTKIMTALVALEEIENIDEVVTIPHEALEGLVEKNAMVVGFREGERVTYRDLLYGVLLPSGADATGTIAYYLAGNEENYVNKMNEKAKSLNLENTHFSDTSGLDDYNNYSTVKDISVLLRYALKNEEFKKIFTTQEYVMSNGIKLKSTLVYYTEKANLQNKYIYGSKTGFTTIAGYCLASIAKNDNQEFLLVTAHAPTTNNYPYHFVDAFNIYDYYIDNYSNQEIVKKEETIYKLKTELSKEGYYEIKATDTIIKYLPKDIDLSLLTYSYNGVEIVNPFFKNQQLGEIRVYFENELLATWPVYYDGSLNISIKKVIVKYPIIIVIGIIVLYLIYKILFKKKKRKKKKNKLHH